MQSRLIKAVRHPVVVFFFGVSIVLFSQGYKARDILIKKSIEQNKVTEQVNEWRASYIGLAKDVKTWNSSYASITNVNDLVSLLAAIHIDQHGVSIDVDKVTLSKAEAVTHNDIPLDLVKACLINVGQGNNLLIKAPSYPKLLKGIDELIERRDISIDSITLGGVKQKQPTAILQNFCLYLKS